MKEVKIGIVDKEIILSATGHTSLLQVLIEKKVEINHSCGGHGTCGTCRIIVQSSPEKLPTPNEIEQEMIVERGFHSNERLSCQLYPTENLEIIIPE